MAVNGSDVGLHLLTAVSRRLLRGFGIAAAVSMMPVLVAPALAHAILVESTPASGGTVAGPDIALDLRFNSRIDQKRSLLLLRKADGTSDRLTILPDAPVDRLKAKTSLPAGSYTLRWQVLATDGHITRGDVPFTVTDAGSARPTTTPAP